MVLNVDQRPRRQRADTCHVSATCDRSLNTVVAVSLLYSRRYCRNGYGSVYEHNNTSSIRLNLFSFLVIISYGFTCFRAHIIKSEILKLTRTQLTEVLWIIVRQEDHLTLALANQQLAPMQPITYITNQAKHQQKHSTNETQRLVIKSRVTLRYQHVDQSTLSLSTYIYC